MSNIQEQVVGVSLIFFSVIVVVVFIFIFWSIVWKLILSRLGFIQEIFSAPTESGSKKARRKKLSSDNTSRSRPLMKDKL
ncbi:hypothetical protein EMCRGX_G031184 [Ephydatia muelleri]